MSIEKSASVLDRAFVEPQVSYGKLGMSEERVPAGERSVGLEALANLTRALHQQGVRYCHWKSNLRLEQSLRGQTDLDLLVDRRHSEVFRRILYEQNVKPVLAPPGKRYPGIEDYVGFDPTSGQLFHLHVHYQLVLGEQFVKNYRLPLESQLLDSVQLRHGVNTPAPEWEIIVLSIRALLKYRDRDVIKDILSIRSPGLPTHILKEIEFLLGQTSLERITETLTGVADIVPADAVVEFLKTVVDTPRAGYSLYRLRERVRRALRGYQRHSRWRATVLYFREMWRRRKVLKSSADRMMTPINGGMSLAIIGADGAGKSTMCQMLAQWLAGRLDVRSYYLGSKQPSRRSELLYILFRMARRSQRAVGRRLGEGHVLSRWMAELRDSLLCTHHLSIGRDRYRRCRTGRKEAMAGSIVIFDRYPLESISTRPGFRLLDGPQIPMTVGEEKGTIRRAFARVEQDLYHNMRLPDTLFVLDVSPDVSLQRKPDHNRATVEAKIRAVEELMAMADADAKEFSLVHLNADLPFEDVLGELRAKIWEVI